MFALCYKSKNILENGVNLLEKNVNTSKRKVVSSSDVILNFWSKMELNQLIKVLPRKTYIASTFIDYILTRSSEKAVEPVLLKNVYLAINFFFAQKNSREKILVNTIILHFGL